MSTSTRMSAREFVAKAVAKDAAWGTEHFVHIAIETLLELNHKKKVEELLAKARIEAAGPRLLLPRVIKVAHPKPIVKAVSKQEAARPRTQLDIQWQNARRLALR